MTPPRDSRDMDAPPATADLSDHSLLRRYRLGSQDAATQLYLRYVQRLRGLARAQMSPALARLVDLEDIVQSVFGSFFRRASTGYYDVPAGEELWRLFLVIALNKVRGRGAFHHAAKRDLRRAAAVPPEALLGVEADEGAACAFLRLVIDDALDRLPPSQRRMVELRIEGHGVADIARETGRSLRTVERLLQEARGRLSELLDEEH
jgi:RNA polymerase sigma-70 factor (ECF subfamily)